MTKEFAVCPHCGKQVIESDNHEYTYQCAECDEDFYSFECEEKNENN